MRKRMKELAGGMIAYSGPILKISSDKVELEVLEGQTATGEFRVSSVDQRKIRGIVYTSGMRMNCLTPQFEGEEAVVRYEFHSEGLHEGNIEKGYFYLICNQCEYSLSFVVTITKPYALSSIGRIRSLKDFQRLAGESPEEAVKIFSSSVFRSIFKETEWKERLAYEALLDPLHATNSMEEFLIACAKKEPVDFSLAEQEKTYELPEEDVSDAVALTVTGQGEFFATIRSDSPVLVPEKETLTRADLNGSSGEIVFLLRRKAMHAGENDAVLTVESLRKTEQLKIKILGASQSEEKEEARRVRSEIAKGRIRLTEDYLSYRLKRMVTGEWAKRTIDLCRHLSALDPENDWYVLMQAQALLVNQQKQEARWILDAYRKEAKAKDTPVYAYFLYLCTLSERESNYVDRLTEEIEEIYHRNPEDLAVFWIRLFLREEFCDNDVKRLAAIKTRCMEGARSPYLYMEAYYQMWMDPHMLERLDDFEIQVLYWAAKRQALSKDLAMQISSRSEQRREFHPLLYKLLCMTYEAYPRDDMVEAVCSYLIRTGHTSDPKYFYWFERGVELNLRITGLSEAYLLSMDMGKAEELPKVIEMYFQYSSTLPKEKKAELFARITKEKKKNQELYYEYRRSMESFALDEMREGAISEDLAIIYDDLLSEGMINEEIALSMEHLMFTYQVQCANPHIVSLVVVHEELKKTERVPVREHSALIRLYTNHYSIAAEDAEGRRFSPLTAELTLKRLMNPVHYLAKCMALADGRLPYVLHHLSGKEHFRESLHAERDNLRLLMSSDQITDAYKLKLCPLLVRLYDDYSDPAELTAYIRIIDGKRLPTENRVELTELLIEKKMYQEAYLMLQQFGTELIDPGKLVPLVSFKIESTDYGEDDFLLALTMEAFRSHKYNDIMLTYLCKCLNAPTEEMEAVWRTAQNFGIDAFELEERILVQALYAARMTPAVQNVFESYEKGGGRQLVMEAYANYVSYCYFVREAVTPAALFEELKKRFLDGADLTEICKLALLKYHTELPETSEEDEKWMDELLAELIEQEMYFAFYRKLPQRLLEKYQFYDKTFLEFRTDPKRRVRLHYALPEAPDQYITEEMQHMFGGIFVRQFVLFFGESIQYYITEEEDGTEKVVLSDQITNMDVFSQLPETRFSLLNEIMLHHTLKEADELIKCMDEYEAKMEIVRREFRAL